MLGPEVRKHALLAAYLASEKKLMVIGRNRKKTSMQEQSDEVTVCVLSWP